MASGNNDMVTWKKRMIHSKLRKGSGKCDEAGEFKNKWCNELATMAKSNGESLIGRPQEN
jgi:hypothetical protein